MYIVNKREMNFKMNRYDKYIVHLSKILFDWISDPTNLSQNDTGQKPSKRANEEKR